MPRPVAAASHRSFHVHFFFVGGSKNPSRKSPFVTYFQVFKMATKWGIASSGLISHDFVNAISILPAADHQVVAVAARALDSAQTFANTFKIPKAYQGYDSLVSDPEVEVVYVGATNPAHFPIAKLMLEGGKHVLCEKPLCMNMKETTELIELARQKNLFLMEAIWSRCLPAYQAVENEIKKGSIGEVKNVIVTFGKKIEAARLHTKELGGGTVLDLGVYCVQLASLAMGKVAPEKVIAGGHLGPGGVDESTSATVLYSGNRTATLVTSSQVDLFDEAYIVGTKGTIKVCYPMWTPTEIETPGGIQSWVLPTGNILPFNYGNGGNMSFEAQHVRECLLNGLKESPLISLNETLIIAQIMQDIRTQAGVVYPQD